ncbi:MAG: polyprenyl synthetase family protein [Sporolactobacillus sp.]|jgi:competence protein ComQ|nr:polyprenyl synthetase family protein [Sporolactobacillus sp.]
MVRVNKENDMRGDLQRFLLHHLKTCGMDRRAQKLITSLLSFKGKIFYAQPAFSWGELFALVESVGAATTSLDDTQLSRAGGFELLVLAADIMDDLTDREAGANTLGVLANEAAPLANLLLTDALFLLARPATDRPDAQLREVIRRLRTAAAGQWEDIRFLIDESTKAEDDYFRLIDRKSGSLMKMAFSACPSDEHDLWMRAAGYIGRSAQLANDARDVFLNTKNDLALRKATLPLIKAVEFSRAKDGGRLLNELQKLESADDPAPFLRRIRAYIRATGAADYCRILAAAYRRKGIRLLENYAERHPNRSAIDRLICFLRG